MENKGKNLSNNNIKNFDSKGKEKGGFYKTIAILLFVLLLIVAWLFFNETQKTKDLIVQQNETVEAKDSLSHEFDNLLAEYESLESSNDTLNIQLGENQAKIKQIMKKLRKEKVVNRGVIKKYKSEMETLRKVMRSFIVQIDSLNTMNVALKEENVHVKKQYRDATSKNDDLTQKNEELTTKVDKASTIKTFNINVLALNRRERKVKKAKKVDKFKVCFTLDENVIAQSGVKDVYIRIVRPDDLVLISSEENLFVFEGQEIAYTSKREVEYDNKEKEMCVFFQNTLNKEGLIPGNYAVDIFTDGKQIGTVDFYLK
ncbi:MAG: cell division protein FtsL [Bacteroidetes bacterium]|nr:cell division protein FtsL [Bacteroidota bacterium]